MYKIQKCGQTLDINKNQKGDNIMKKRGILILNLSCLLVIFLGVLYSTFGMQHYQVIDFSTGIVTATKLNVRQGPGMKFKVVDTVKKNEYIRVFAKIGNWYVVQTDGDIIGTVNADYIKAVYPSNTTQNQDTESNTPVIQQDSVPDVTVPEEPVLPTLPDGVSEEEQEVLTLINIEREKVGLDNLEFDVNLQKVARLKGQDITDNNYFSHISPTYGSPFDMIKKNNISYRTAGENIAGNSNIKAAVEDWMKSQEHKENILNSSYNYTGIGVVSNPKYGKVIVQMFVGR